MRHILLTSVAFVSAFSAAQAHSETVAAESGMSDEIVVTAQKRSESVQQVPIAITAITADYLHSRNISSIDNLGSIAPNLKIERAPSNKTAAQISIRGSVTINPAITWEPAVGLYLDGVYIAKVQGSVFDIADLERVEVLRKLREGAFDCVVGVNLLREGLDLPEVSMVAILDADKEGFLRSETSLSQTIGRTARHVDAGGVLSADGIHT